LIGSLFVLTSEVCTVAKLSLLKVGH